MATYHMTLELRPGQLPGLDHPPLFPRDIVADSEADALGEAEGSLAEVIHKTWEYALESVREVHAALQSLRSISRNGGRTPGTGVVCSGK